MQPASVKAVSREAMAAVPRLLVVAVQAATSTPPVPSTGGGQSNAAKAASSLIRTSALSGQGSGGYSIGTTFTSTGYFNCTHCTH